MRTPNLLVEAYSDAIFSPSSRPNFFVRRDICQVDLCLHFLATHFPGESVWIMPTLLQGHIGAWIPPQSRRALFRLRQYANNLCSRLAWRSALNEHGEYSRTAYSSEGGTPLKRPNASASLIQILSEALQSNAPYPSRELKLGKSGKAIIEDRVQEEEASIHLPNPKNELPLATVLKRREVNPPISIRWDTLIAVAKEVDERERSPGFPRWLPKLNLEQRLQKVHVKAVDQGFFRDGSLVLDGTKHVVGMLSSGKSTLLQAILFALISPGYDKRVLVLSRDTAAAAELIARFKAHGFERSTVVSSINNRDEHLSAALWNTQSYPSDQALDAAASLTESLDTSCPLDGYQKQEESLVAKRLRRPCNNLAQKTSNGGIDTVSCPLISVCPTHRQQRDMLSANVIAMTPQAFIKMTPERYALKEEMSFPEAMQFLADVVLIDEADEVQRTFDEQCTQQQGLLSADGRAFTLTSTRALASALGNKGGGQYAKSSNVQWHRQFNRLQDSIGSIYHLFLKHREAFAWIISQKTFTSASILASLWRNSTGHAGSESTATQYDAYIVDHLEQLAALSGVLYNAADFVGSAQSRQAKFDAINSAPLLHNAFKFLAEIQPSVVEMSLGPEPEGLLEQVLKELDGGKLAIFSSDEAPSHSQEKRPARAFRTRTVKPATDNFSRALAIVLALLTNHCLSSFSYLVRNQAAVEDDFGLQETDVFREARRIMRHYGGLIPRPLLGSVFGLMFEPAGETSESGGTLRLINHLALGRFLLTHLDKLLSDEGQAGPHVLLLSGTSWAGGSSPNASPLFDVQWPVSAILEQPSKERDALLQSRSEFVSLGATAIPVSGQPPDVRRENLKRIATLLTKPGVAGTFIESKWDQLAAADSNGIYKYRDRRRALLVTNNYDDAKWVANCLAQTNSPKHSIYCLVSDSMARQGEVEKDALRTGDAFHRDVQILPRSRVETFGMSPQGSILVAPLHPISRGHNIVMPETGCAAISTIYFLHRPHPRPDDLAGVIGSINRFAMDVVLGKEQPDGESIEAFGNWFRRKAQDALDQGFAMRTAYALMSDLARIQYSWDLITSLWQTIGRGIRGGVPVYVGFVDERFSPGIYKNPVENDTVYSSCLKQCLETLEKAMSAEQSNMDSEIARTLYQPFSDMLSNLFCASVQKEDK